MTIGNDQHEFHRQERDFLLQGAIWQDSLLQSYRSLHGTLQAILLAIGTGLFIAFLAAETSDKLKCLVLFLIFFLMHRLLNGKMKAIVQNRGDDVDYWHRAIIQTERRLSIVQRQFTKFKIAQKIKSDQNEEMLNSIFLAEETDRPEYSACEIEKLLGKLIGHTRKVVDEQLFIGISICWTILIIAAAMVLSV